MAVHVQSRHVGSLPQNFEEVVETFKWYFSGGDTMRWWGHLNPTSFQKNLFELFALTGGRDPKPLGASARA